MSENVISRPQERDTATEIIYTVLCCLMVSFINGGFWLLVPFLNGTVAFGLGLVIIVFTLFDESAREYFIYTQKAYGVLVFFLLTAIYMIKMSVPFKESSMLQSFYCIVIMLIGAHYSQSDSMRKPFMIYVLAELIFKMIINIVMLIKDPYIVRTSGVNVISVNGTGLEKMVSIYLLYTLAVVGYVLMSNFQFSKSKFLSVVLIVTILWLLMLAQMTLVFICTLIMMVFILFIRSEHYAQTVVILVMLGIVLLIFAKPILSLVKDFEILGDATRERLRDLYDLLFGGNSLKETIEYYGGNRKIFVTSSVRARLHNYIRSYIAMRNNLFFGYLKNNYEVNGGHSLWLDMISEYGILIVVFFVSVIKYIRWLLNSEVEQNRKAVICFLLSYIFLGVFNYFSIIYFCLQLYIILPYLYEIVANVPEPEEDEELQEELVI